MLNDHEVARIVHGAEELGRRINESASDPEIIIGEDVQLSECLIVAMVRWTGDEGEDREAPVVWSERRSYWMKLGILDAARLEVIADGENAESD